MFNSRVAPNPEPLMLMALPGFTVSCATATVCTHNFELPNSKDAKTSSHSAFAAIPDLGRVSGLEGKSATTNLPELLRSLCPHEYAGPALTWAHRSLRAYRNPASERASSAGV